MTVDRNTRRPVRRRAAAILRRATLAGIVLVLALPAARGHNPWLGWMPLWLVGMPLAAWWASQGFALRPAVAPLRGRRRARRSRPQARRLQVPARGAAGIARAA